MDRIGLDLDCEWCLFGFEVLENALWFDDFRCSRNCEMSFVLIKIRFGMKIKLNERKLEFVA